MAQQLSSKDVRGAVVAALTAAGVASAGGGVVENRRAPWPDDDNFPRVSVYTASSRDSALSPTGRLFMRTETIGIDCAVRITEAAPEGDVSLADALDDLHASVMSALWGSESWPPSSPAKLQGWGDVQAERTQGIDGNARLGLLSMRFDVQYHHTVYPPAPDDYLEQVTTDIDFGEADNDNEPDGTPELTVITDGLESA